MPYDAKHEQQETTETFKSLGNNISETGPKLSQTDTSNCFDYGINNTH